MRRPCFLLDVVKPFDFFVCFSEAMMKDSLRRDRKLVTYYWRVGK